MDLKSGYPFWPIRDGLPATHPRLTSSTKVDVAVIGAGITGAIAAHRLATLGYDVMVIDARDVGLGSTSASTALLQYEIDTTLVELSELYGESNAVAAYRACLKAIDDLEQLDQSVGHGGKFIRRPSFYVAANEADVASLQKEYELRLQHGFPVTYWQRERIEGGFEFSAPGGIMSDAGGDLDPYAFAHALLSSPALHNRVFDRTAVETIEWGKPAVRIHLSTGAELICNSVIVACGYESLPFLPPIDADLHCTFAMVTEPLRTFPKWHERCLIWDTDKPYLYCRTTDDGRILAGGEDCNFDDESTRDRLLPEKIQCIEKKIRALFPSVDFAVDFGWAGTFAETSDGLPFIGVHPDRPGGFFLLCYGGNGITYSMIGADMLVAKLRGDAHPLTALFGFERATH